MTTTIGQITAVNPATEELIASFDAFAPDEVEMALAEAQEAYLGWRQRYNAVGTEEWARFEEGKPTKEALERAAAAIRVAKPTAPSPHMPAGEAEDMGDDV